MRSSFEGLHALWSPMTSVPSLSGADLRKSMTCAFIEPDARRQEFSESPAAEACKQSGFFRFTSVFTNRTFAVDRAPAHVRTFLDATQTSFPELMVPSYVENNPYSGIVILEFLKNHADALFSYTPLLFFLFEVDFKVASDYFTSLENFLRNVKSLELTKMSALKPKAAKGWFSFGSAKPKEVQYSFVENVEFIDTFALQLPRGFMNHFVSFSSKKDRIVELSKSIDAMAAALLRNNDELRNVSEEMGCVPQLTVPDLCPNGEVDVERSNEIRKRMGLLQQACFLAFEKESDASQHLKSLVAYTKQAEYVVISIENYLLEYIKLKDYFMRICPS
ncbi:hypothetical protein STCU_09812 [Strigomonas culicis]|uniref:Uncharacterized protein n=1 Tax=Strigomonas culicis TaxID=28005 RepID=S9TPX0_9TRYP|nr:hypothetical protein STCU_09812 [Strigomonas culicis]|eukprot:EPY18689.1 hypothetical protein STCU_09812 [Strigomonas culicis]